MYSSSYRIVHNAADAEDILQESFLAAFQGIQTFTEGYSFEGWLRRIVINKSISHLRAKKILWMEELQDVIADDTTSADDELDFQTHIEAIKKAIAGLTLQSRLVFTLYAIDDMPHSDIADMLQLSPGNVRVIYMRAKRQILETLKMKNNHDG